MVNRFRAVFAKANEIRAVFFPFGSAARGVLEGPQFSLHQIRQRRHGNMHSKKPARHGPRRKTRVARVDRDLQAKTAARQLGVDGMGEISTAKPRARKASATPASAASAKSASKVTIGSAA